MTKLAGIDYSLPSPAICVWKQDADRLFDFDSGDLYYLDNAQQLSVKKEILVAMSGIATGNIPVYDADPGPFNPS